MLEGSSPSPGFRKLTSMAFLGFWSRHLVASPLAGRGGGWRCCSGWVGRPLSLFRRGRRPARTQVRPIPASSPPRHPSTLVVGHRRSGRRGFTRSSTGSPISPRSPKPAPTPPSTRPPWTDKGPRPVGELRGTGQQSTGATSCRTSSPPPRERRPDPTRADEIAVNEESARLFGYHVGPGVRPRHRLGRRTSRALSRQGDERRHPAPCAPAT